MCVSCQARFSSRLPKRSLLEPLGRVGSTALVLNYLLPPNLTERRVSSPTLRLSIPLTRSAARWKEEGKGVGRANSEDGGAGRRSQAEANGE
jgi:hypothetical protein